MNSSFLVNKVVKRASKIGFRTIFPNQSRYCSDDKRGAEKDPVNVEKLLDEAASFEDEDKKDAEEWSTSPYPKGTWKQSQGRHSYRPMINPSETSIILFPGQGTQYVGMCSHVKNFPVARDLFEIASSILKYDLMKLCMEGPKGKLYKTKFAQPAILVCSLAALEKLKEEKPSAIENCMATAGFSLGEITALVFAQVLSFKAAVKLVQMRAEAMQIASEMEKGAMATLLYRPDSKLGQAFQKAKEYAQECGVENAYCGISNYLFPHCKIVAGNVKAIEFLEKNKDEFNLKKLMRLPVSGAFHTPLMQPAADTFHTAVKKANLSDPIIAVHSNIDGKCYRGADHIRRSLAKHIVRPVRWEQTMHILYERPPEIPFPKTYECGPGTSLSTILKMVNLKAAQEMCNVAS